jgi:hypothetical protein
MYVSHILEEENLLVKHDEVWEGFAESSLICGDLTHVGFADWPGN